MNMKKAAKVLTNYILVKGMIGEEDREAYEYGFEITLEVGLFSMFCLFVSLYTHMFVEGIIFFIIFVPLRSYAGGLHLKRYCSCFLLSCLTFIGVLLGAQNIQISMKSLFVILPLMAIIIMHLYPVENINRKADEEEIEYFKKKLKLFLGVDILMAYICIVLQNAKCLSVIVITFFIIAVTMLIGKIKNRNMVEN